MIAGRIANYLTDLMDGDQFRTGPFVNGARMSEVRLDNDAARFKLTCPEGEFVVTVRQVESE